MIENINLIAGIASLILAIISIWLSLYFYRQSNKAYNSMFSVQQKTKKILSNVKEITDKVADRAFDLIENNQTAMNNKFLNASVGSTDNFDPREYKNAESENRTESIKKDKEKSSSEENKDNKNKDQESYKTLMGK